MRQRISLFYLIFTCITCDLGSSLKITSITVPKVILSGQSIRLTCHFKLEGDPLYSLTWWKDDLPFYSFVQANGPKISVFQLPGIYVDKDGSSLHEVHLAHVDHRASGEIKCEVLADYPSFEKDSLVNQMLVVERPHTGPKITGRTMGFRVGDLLLLNCSSPPSFPPAKLTWFINNQQASTTETVVVYPAEGDGQGRESSKSGLQMFLQHHHFRSGVLLLRCRASILDFYTKSAEAAIMDSDFREPSRQEQIARSRSTALSPDLKWIIVSWIAIVHSLLFQQHKCFTKASHLSLTVSLFRGCK